MASAVGCPKWALALRASRTFRVNLKPIAVALLLASGRKNPYNKDQRPRTIEFYGRKLPDFGAVCAEVGRINHKERPASMSSNGFRNGSSNGHNLRSLFSLFSSDLAIDLGKANTLVYARGKGIVVNATSIVALTKNFNDVEAVTNEAAEMLG